jgi:hypothetical protein
MCRIQTTPFSHTTDMRSSVPARLRHVYAQLTSLRTIDTVRDLSEVALAHGLLVGAERAVVGAHAQKVTAVCLSSVTDMQQPDQASKFIR